jgi:hypothetical protein
LENFRHLTPALSPFEAEREKPLCSLRSFAVKKSVSVRVHPWLKSFRVFSVVRGLKFIQRIGFGKRLNCAAIKTKHPVLVMRKVTGMTRTKSC